MHTSHFIIEYSWNKSEFNFIISLTLLHSDSRFDEIENPFYYCYIFHRRRCGRREWKYILILFISMICFSLHALHFAAQISNGLSIIQLKVSMLRRHMYQDTVSEVNEACICKLCDSSSCANGNELKNVKLYAYKAHHGDDNNIIHARG